MTVHEVRITRVTAMKYHMPLRRPYGTARGVARAGINFLVRLTAATGTDVVEGVGECQPRHALTGDGGKDRTAAWGFACAAAQHLHGRSLRFSDPAGAVTAVRGVIREIGEVAQQHAGADNRDRPFRGTLLGIEVALLDVVSRHLKLQVAELLGQRRDGIGVSISTISSAIGVDQIATHVGKQIRFPMTRVKGTGDVAYDLELLELVARTNRSLGREKPLWIDINEALDRSGAETLVRELVERMSAGVLPASFILEGPVPKERTTDLPHLQRLADERCRAVSGGRALDLRIMPDEGLWDVDDLAMLNSLGGCRAINIKAPKAGGLLASLDLANAAVAADPDVHICIGGMVGTSDITAWTLHNLARALPRLDYLTAVPPQNVRERIADPLAAYAAPGSNVIAGQTTPGIGTRLRSDKVAPYVHATFDSAPAPSVEVRVEPTVEAAAARTLVFAGDTSLGDVYIRRAGGDLLDRLERNPMSFFDGIRPLVADKDALLVNLETVLADSPGSPFHGRKSYLGWDSPGRTTTCLKELGVDAVTLANNHTMDFGRGHLLKTSAFLRRAGIASFGAGRSQAGAAAPLTLKFSFDGVLRRVHVIGAMQIQPKLRDEFAFYAGKLRAGVNAMSVPRITAQIRKLRDTDPTSLVIIYPHWGHNYQWATGSMRSAAQAFIHAGADLILGHGAHTLGQCSFLDGQAVAYSLGNFLFNWAGRFEKLQAPPFGLIGRVNVVPEGAAWGVGVHLYPIMADNRRTNHRPEPVDDNAFEIVWSTLSQADLDGSFNKHANAQRDSFGHNIAYSFTTGTRS
jgi:L-alanine-DL-glutamate epimerase-like enolase superfamily enzyme